MTNGNGETALVTQTEEFQLPDRNSVEQTLEQIKQFQSLIRGQLKKGHDFGEIPGTNSKNSLLKPGAEKIAKLLGLADSYEVMDKVVDWDKGLFQYEVRASLTASRTGQLISQGVGECNSYESKYRWRQKKHRCPTCAKETVTKGKREYGGGWICWKKPGVSDGCGDKWPDGTPEIEGQEVGRVPNPDPADQVNTILKMAKKRALVDAVLSVAALSNVFTQDMEGPPPEQQPVPPRQPATPKGTLAHTPAQPSPWEKFKTFLADEGRHMTDVGLVIGSDATRSTLSAWAKAEGLESMQAICDKLAESWNTTVIDSETEDEVDSDDDWDRLVGAGPAQKENA